jgi:aryl-alcohol dehydrogenase-like predicted oxidoreductase
MHVEPLEPASRPRRFGRSAKTVFADYQADVIDLYQIHWPEPDNDLEEIEKEILPFALRENIGVIVYSPMSAGLLTGAMTRERVANFSTEDWRRNLPNFQQPLLSRNLKLVESLRAIGSKYGRTPGEVAIAWTLKNPAVTGAIVGFRNPKQVSGILGAAELLLQPTEMAEIEDALKPEGIT